MGTLIVTGDSIYCTMAASAPNVPVASVAAVPAPASKIIIANPQVGTTQKPTANIYDCIPGTNIVPFVACKSPGNPTAVAATATLTAAAAGVPTPGTGACQYAPMLGTWVPGCPTLMVRGAPAVNNTCTTNCIWGGTIGFQPLPTAIPNPPPAALPTIQSC